MSTRPDYVTRALWKHLFGEVHPDEIKFQLYTQQEMDDMVLSFEFLDEYESGDSYTRESSL